MRGKPTLQHRKMVQFTFKDVSEMREFLYALLELSNANGVVPMYMKYKDTQKIGLVLEKLTQKTSASTNRL